MSTVLDTIDTTAAEGWGPASEKRMHVLLIEHPDRAPRLQAHRIDGPGAHEFCRSGRPRQPRGRGRRDPQLRTFLGSWPVVESRDSDGHVALHICERPKALQPMTDLTGERAR